MEYKKLGRFHIDRSIARGGMGEVVKTIDDSGVPIALKTILNPFHADKKFRDLFIREAEITFQLRHRNIVKAYRFEEVGNRLVLALEFLDGVTLKEVLRRIYDRKLHMPLVIAVSMMERVLQGLQYAHDKSDSKGRHLGIIHRDLNPSNIFITYEGEVKILDFGISKATQMDVHQLTPKNELRGKICYLAPEQIQGERVDHRADIFAMGIVLWETLAGQPLYVREVDAEVMEAICDGEYRDIRQIRPDVPIEVDQVIRKALSKNPKDRFQDCNAFAKALKRASMRFCMPGTAEKEISVYLKSVLNKVENKEDANFLSGYSWLLTQIPGQVEQGLKMSQEMAERYPTRPFVQLNYARALLAAGDRVKGLRLMRKLARVDSLEMEVQLILEWLGVRRKPVIGSLARGNPLNYSLGWIRHQILGPTAYQEMFLSA